MWRCAKRELKRIIDVENKSNNDLRGAMQEGAKKGLFSEDRPKNESAGEEVQSPRAVNFFKEKEAREKEPKKVREIISRERFDIPPSGSPQPEAEDDGLVGHPVLIYLHNCATLMSRCTELRWSPIFAPPLRLTTPHLFLPGGGSE